MGLDDHDMENLGEVWVGYDGKPKSTQFGRKSLRLARPLEPGMVHTIEPGVYFIPELIDLLEEGGPVCRPDSLLRGREMARLGRCAK